MVRNEIEPGKIAEQKQGLIDINSAKSYIRYNGDKPTRGDFRTVSVDTKNPVFKDFMALGSNIFSQSLAPNGKKGLPYNEACFELDTKRYHSLRVHTARFMFNIDWVITNEEENPRRKDVENNKDYINYMNGVYDFESEEMKAAYKYLDELKAMGTEVSINLGWKIGSRIFDWWPLEHEEETARVVSAPKDPDAFGRCAAAIIKELKFNRGYDNITFLSFYNEIGSSGDFRCLPGENFIPRWCEMIRHVDNHLKLAGIRDDIKIMCSEIFCYPYFANHYWFDDIMADIGDIIDVCSFHCYYSSSYQWTVHNFESNYEMWFKTFNYLRERYKKPIYITEFFAGVWGNTDGMLLGDVGWQSWEDSYTSYFIACANAGITSMMKWETNGGWITGALGVDDFGVYLQSPMNDSWSLVFNEDAVNNVYHAFYEESLLNSYVRPKSEVLHVDWDGNDIRTAAFRGPDGEYTVIVEAAGRHERIRPLEIKFDAPIGKKFRKFVYNPWNVKPDARTNIITDWVDMGVVSDKIEDKLNRDYSVYIYTTYEPVKQISMETVQVNCEPGKTVKLEANMIDCAADDEIVWTVTKKNGKENEVKDITGSISADGVYTADGDVIGDIVAIRASLKSNAEVFSVALIRIKSKEDC